MKFDTVIIGGGLSGLTCGIKLAEEGRRCAIVSSGQSALHFFSGSFDLLGYNGETEIHNPIEAISKLDATHPYSKLGASTVERLAKEAKEFFETMGAKFVGDTDKNHYRITPVGVKRLTWLTLENLGTLGTDGKLPWQNVCIVNIAGFLDFHTTFIASEFEKMGVHCTIKAIMMPEMERLRKNPTEMRSSNIAKVLNNKEVLARFAQLVNSESAGCEAVILPAVFGVFNPDTTNEFKSLLDKPMMLLPTLPPSVPGIRLQIMMRNYFQRLGGVYLLGDTAQDGQISYSKVTGISTVNQGDIQLEANSFVLASGSFFSHGLIAHPNKIEEPVFDLDVLSSENRADWYNKDLFEKQPYMEYGVETDEQFHAKYKGNTLKNLYAIGSVLCGYDPLKESSGAGVSILTAMSVAEQILKKGK
ncbi:MAG: glycerol-3-phosphate dehydrogenase subunit GlpB [Muribaculaceae bacterium]|nr:glycerol-3-phosphate dehydrogenase subunit GlpB [Muribaculaceae bacterium]